LILFDTSTIHAGKPPCPAGSDRLALTNYYFTARGREKALAYYRPLVKLHVAS
jgi:hypothetical protein